MQYQATNRDGIGEESREAHDPYGFDDKAEVVNANGCFGRHPIEPGKDWKQQPAQVEQEDE